MTTSIGNDRPVGDTDRLRLELTAILDNTSVGIVFTRDRAIQRCNRRLAEIFGYPGPEDLIGKPAIVLYADAESYDRVSREASALLAAGKPYRTDWLGTKADDSPLWCKVYGRAVDPANTDQEAVWIVEDVTEARRTEATLRKTLRETEAFMQNANVAITFTRDRRVIRYNPSFRKMFGIEGDRAIGVPARVLYRSDEEYAAARAASGSSALLGQAVSD